MHVFPQTMPGRGPPASCPQPRHGSCAGRPGKALRWVRWGGCSRLSRVGSSSSTLTVTVRSEAPGFPTLAQPSTQLLVGKICTCLEINPEERGGEGPALRAPGLPPARPTLAVPLQPFTSICFPICAQCLWHAETQRSSQSWTSEMPAEGSSRGWGKASLPWGGLPSMSPEG